MKGAYLLSGIDNDEMGKVFLEQIRYYLNHEKYRIRVRGNGPRAAVARKEGMNPRAYDQDIPLSKAETFRVYVDPKGERAFVVPRGYYDETVKQLNAANKELEYYKAENDALHKANEGLVKVQATLERRYFDGYNDGMKQRIAWEEQVVPKWLQWLVRRFT